MHLDHDTERALLRLIARYCFALDERRFAEVGALFTEDGTWDAPYARATGPMEIERLLSGLVPVSPRRRHFTSNRVLEPSSEGARGRTYYMNVLDGEMGPRIGSVGLYIDEFRLDRNGDWKFGDRRLQMEFSGDVGLVAPKG